MLAPLNVVVFFALHASLFVGLCLAHPDFLSYGRWRKSQRFTSAKRSTGRSRFTFIRWLLRDLLYRGVAVAESMVAMWKEKWAKAFGE